MFFVHNDKDDQTASSGYLNQRPRTLEEYLEETKKTEKKDNQKD